MIKQLKLIQFFKIFSLMLELVALISRFSFFDKSILFKIPPALTKIIPAAISHKFKFS